MKDGNMKRKLLAGAAAFVIVAAVVLGGIKLYRIHQMNQSGILLAFDDYSEDSWRANFELFSEYGAKVTFFVNLSEPTEFCYDAEKEGHEIGFHTVEHVNLKEATEEAVYQQAIAPIEVFRKEGIELTTFAYPYGAQTEQLDEMLLEHYNVVRGAYHLELHGKHELRKGFVDSMSLDNANFDSQEAYEQKIMEVLNELKGGKGRVASFYSHVIGDGEWCISTDRLEFLLRKAKEMGLQFYTFQELQYW